MNTLYKSRYIFLLAMLFMLSACTETMKEALSDIIFTKDHHGMQGDRGADSWEDLKQIPAEGRDIAVTVVAEPSTSWSIQGLPDWLTATPSSGKGNADVTFHASRNAQVEISRSAIVELVSNVAEWPVKKQFMVTQKGSERRITVSPDNDASYVFGANGGYMDIQIGGNAGWKLNCKSDFCKLSITEGSGDAVTRLTVSAYNTLDIANRYAYIEVTDENNVTVKTIKVTQTPISTSVNTQYKDVEIDHAGGSSRLSDLGRVEGEYSVSSSDPSWLTVTQSSTTGNIDVTVSATANNTGSTRDAYAYVYLSTEKNKALYAIKVTQSSSFLTLGSTSENFPAAGGTREVSVSSSESWSTTCEAEWLSLRQGETGLEISAKENLTAITRSAEITVTNGIQTEKIIVKQDAGSSYLTLSESSLAFTSVPGTQNFTITTNGDWTVSSNSAWLTVDQTSGFGSATINVSAEDNASANSRSAYLSIKNSITEETQQISVTQAPRTLSVSEETLNYSENGGSINVIATTDASSSDISAVSSSTSWLTVTRNGNILSINAAANSSTSERTGTITVSLKNIEGTLAKTISVTQAAGVSQENGNLTFTANGISFVLVYVESGTFTMGATSEQVMDAYSNEKPTHSVTLSSYYIGQTEVTQELWQAVMGSNPSHFSGSNRYLSAKPVEQVSWDDCQEFITKLNSLTGKKFSLPTEAQWEYAARGGQKQKVLVRHKYSGSNTINDIAWYDGNSNDQTHAVGTKTPNELGIFDMSGNVWEWCQDWYGSYGSTAQTNPTGPSSGSRRVSRGGSWFDFAGNCRVSFRSSYTPDYRNYSLGLRLVLLP